MQSGTMQQVIDSVTNKRILQSADAKERLFDMSQ